MPRILASAIPQNVGRNVILIGELLEFDGSLAKLHTPDGAMVIVSIPGEEAFALTNA